MGIEIEDNVKLINAINPDNIVLRNSMIPTLLSFVNENKTYAPDFGIFEIARVVEGKKENGECNERKKLGVILFSRTKTEKELYFGLRDILMDLVASIKHNNFTFKNREANHNWQHPKNTANVLLENEVLGFINTLHPAVLTKIDKKAAIVAAEIDMDSFADAVKKTIKYKEPSKFPGIDIDLSLDITGGSTFSDIEKTWENKTDLLSNVGLIDIYEDAGKKSITIRLSFSSNEKTLSKAEVQDIIDSITGDMAKIGVNLKG